MSKHANEAREGPTKVVIQLNGPKLGLSEVQREGLELLFEQSVTDGIDFERTIILEIVREMKSDAKTAREIRAFEAVISMLIRRRAAFRRSWKRLQNMRHDGCECCDEARKLIEHDDEPEEPTYG